eukprot:321507-Chlamydomonas_euryale.AAC.3
MVHQPPASARCVSAPAVCVRALCVSARCVCAPAVCVRALCVSARCVCAPVVWVPVVCAPALSGGEKGADGRLVHLRRARRPMSTCASAPIPPSLIRTRCGTGDLTGLVAGHFAAVSLLSLSPTLSPMHQCPPPTAHV